MRGVNRVVMNSMLAVGMAVIGTSRLYAESPYHFQGAVQSSGESSVCCCRTETHQCLVVNADESPLGKSAETKCHDTGIGWDVQGQAACAAGPSTNKEGD